MNGFHNPQVADVSQKQGNMPIYRGFNSFMAKKWKIALFYLKGPWICRVHSVPVIWMPDASMAERLVCETRHWMKFTARVSAAYWHRQAWGGLSHYRIEIERVT